MTAATCCFSATACSCWTDRVPHACSTMLCFLLPAHGALWLHPGSTLLRMLKEARGLLCHAVEEGRALCMIMITGWRGCPGQHPAAPPTAPLGSTPRWLPPTGTAWARQHEDGKKSRRRTGARWRWVVQLVDKCMLVHPGMHGRSPRHLLHHCTRLTACMCLKKTPSSRCPPAPPLLLVLR
jgi:hypothetical protein